MVFSQISIRDVFVVFHTNMAPEVLGVDTVEVRQFAERLRIGFGVLNRGFFAGLLLDLASGLVFGLLLGHLSNFAGGLGWLLSVQRTDRLFA